MKDMDNILFERYMKQDEPFSVFLEKFMKEEDTGDSTTFTGKTPQGTLNPDEDEEEDNSIETPSSDYKDDDKVVKIGQSIG